MISQKKSKWSSLQFEDVGTDKLTGISALRSNKLYTISNASSSPDGKGSNGHKKQYWQQANTTTVGVKLDSLLKIRFEVLILMFLSSNKAVAIAFEVTFLLLLFYYKH